MLDISKLQQMVDSGMMTQWFLAVLLAFTGLALASSILATPVLLILVILSRTKEVTSKPKKNTTFFQDISIQEFEVFKETVSNITDDEIIEDLISQVYITSKITSIKYRILRWAYISFTIFFISTFIYSLLIYFSQH